MSKIDWQPIATLPIGYKKTLITRDEYEGHYDYALVIELDNGSWFQVGVQPITLDDIKQGFKEWAFV